LTPESIGRKARLSSAGTACERSKDISVSTVDADDLLLTPGDAFEVQVQVQAWVTSGSGQVGLALVDGSGGILHLEDPGVITTAGMEGYAGLSFKTTLSPEQTGAGRSETTQAGTLRLFVADRTATTGTLIVEEVQMIVTRLGSAGGGTSGTTDGNSMARHGYTRKPATQTFYQTSCYPNGEAAVLTQLPEDATSERGTNPTIAAWLTNATIPNYELEYDGGSAGVGNDPTMILADAANNRHIVSPGVYHVCVEAAFKPTLGVTNPSSLGVGIVTYELDGVTPQTSTFEIVRSMDYARNMGAQNTEISATFHALIKADTYAMSQVAMAQRNFTTLGGLDLDYCTVTVIRRGDTY